MPIALDLPFARKPPPLSFAERVCLVSGLTGRLNFEYSASSESGRTAHQGHINFLGMHAVMLVPNVSPQKSQQIEQPCLCRNWRYKLASVFPR
jgi:hypothetical protein